MDTDNSHTHTFKFTLIDRMYMFLLPMLSGEDLDARHILGFLFYSSGINNAGRQPLTGF